MFQLICAIFDVQLESMKLYLKRLVRLAMVIKMQWNNPVLPGPSWNEPLATNFWKTVESFHCLADNSAPRHVPPFEVVCELHPVPFSYVPTEVNPADVYMRPQTIPKFLKPGKVTVQRAPTFFNCQIQRMPLSEPRQLSQNIVCGNIVWPPVYLV